MKWTRDWAELFFNERGNIGGGKSKQRHVETVQQTQAQQQQQAQRTEEQRMQQQVQQTAVLPMSPQEQQQLAASQQSELFRLFLMQRLAQEQFQEPLMTPFAQEGLRTLNENFRDERDIRGFTGQDSPVEQARALGVSSYLARLQQDAFQKRLALSSVLGPSPGALGMMGLQQQARLAGSPTTTTTIGNLLGGQTSNLTNLLTNAQTGNRTLTGSGSQQGFNMGDFGNLLTGAGNLYGAYRNLGTPTLAPSTIGGPVGGYGGGYVFS